MNENVIGVKFKDNETEYVFNYFGDMGDLCIGDYVVVDTRYGFKVATVTSYRYDGDYDISHELKEVVCKVDTTDFYNRKERQKRLKHLKQKMDDKVKNLQNIAIYEMLAEKDPELKSMLSEFKELS